MNLTTIYNNTHNHKTSDHLLLIYPCAITLCYIIGLVLLPLQQVAAYTSTLEYYHYNHQGSLLEVYDGTTNKRLLSQAWSPWGERQILHTTTPNGKKTASDLLTYGLPVHMGYTGHKELLATGLVFAGDTRLYDPRLKRFLNSDDRTTGGVKGQNRYSYAYNNPMTYIDPDGHVPVGFWEGMQEVAGGEVTDVIQTLVINYATPLGQRYQGGHMLNHRASRLLLGLASELLGTATQPRPRGRRYIAKYLARELVKLPRRATDIPKRGSTVAIRKDARNRHFYRQRQLAVKAIDYYTYYYKKQAIYDQLLDDYDYQKTIVIENYTSAISKGMLVETGYDPHTKIPEKILQAILSANEKDGIQLAFNHRLLRTINTDLHIQCFQANCHYGRGRFSTLAALDQYDRKSHKKAFYPLPDGSMVDPRGGIFSVENIMQQMHDILGKYGLP